MTRLLSFATLFAFATLSPSLAQAVLVYDWQIPTDGDSGPVSGTISFDINSGEGGANLTPTSLIIDAAVGHTLASSYTFGAEMIGHQAWNAGGNPAMTEWEISPSDVITAGFAMFLHFDDSASTFDELRLEASASSSSMFETDKLMAAEAETTGIATFALQSVPEPTAFLLVGAVASAVAMRRRRPQS